MSTFLPTDSNDNPIPVLRLKPDGAHAISATTGASARNSTAFSTDTRAVSVYADTDVYIQFGDGTVTAASTNHFFPAGLYYDISVGETGHGNKTHVAVRAVTADGNVYISEKE